VNLAPTASVLIDLSKDLDHVLSKMHKATRYGVRASQRTGIRVRDGKQEDLDTFHELLLATARRQRFSTMGKDYLYEVWRLFSPGGHIKMFVAEYEGQAVSAKLMMSFADTVTTWKGCWSGTHRRRHPNEALQWAAIQWAKAQGYHCYDLGGIPRTLAESILGGEIIRNSAKYPVAFYKLGFGGQVTLFPEPLAYVYNATLRRIASRLPHLEAKGQLQRVINRFK
jgi:lipid II:glycine glycyltransferase (peptidoglycan interpeptide bridge formation enzyme)